MLRRFGLLPGVGILQRSAGLDGFTSGTTMVFAQTTAPIGWTKSAAHNDKALRVVTGAASSGGATAFSSVFGSGKTTGSTVLTTSHLPASGLSVTVNGYTSIGAGGTEIVGTVSSDVLVASKAFTTSNMGSGQGHTHTESLDLQYVDVIIATKD